jgi:hypothetical protein
MTELRNHQILEFKFKFFEKNKKNLQKLCKKIRSNYKNIGEEKISNLDCFVG